jgi:hypothetical protein
MPASGFKHVMSANDIGLQNSIEAVLDTNAAEVHYCARASNQPVNRAGVS